MTEPINNPTRGFRELKLEHAVGIIVIAFLVIFTIGVVGFKQSFDMSTRDAVYSTAMTISNLDIGHYKSNWNKKAFLGAYSLLCQLFFITLASTVVAYIFTLYFN